MQTWWAKVSCQCRKSNAVAIGALGWIYIRATGDPILCSLPSYSKAEPSLEYTGSKILGPITATSYKGACGKWVQLHTSFPVRIFMFGFVYSYITWLCHLSRTGLLLCHQVQNTSRASLTPGSGLVRPSLRHATVSPAFLSNHFQALRKRKEETVGEKINQKRLTMLLPPFRSDY